MTLLRPFLMRAFYPTVLFGCVGALVLAMQRELMPLAALVACTVLFAALLVALAELVIPDREQQVPARTMWNDILHTFLCSHGATALLKAVAFGGLFAAAAALSGWLGVSLWPGSWPLGLQLAFGLAIGELGSYSVHRLCHASPFWWRIHALHHSAEELYLLAAGRNHPLNAILTYGAQTAPLVLLGASPEVIALAAAFTGVQGVLQHSNVAMRTGWLSWIFAVPELHRTHHAVDMVEGNTNFGNNLIVWDVVFGTRLAVPAPEAYGVEGVAWPRGWWGQVLTPFTYPRLQDPGPRGSPQRPQPGPALGSEEGLGAARPTEKLEGICLSTSAL